MNTHTHGCCGRRHFLASSGYGLGAFGLAWLLRQDGALAKPIDVEARHYDLLPKQPPFAPKAKAMISMFMQGGPSHIDLFDPKPALDKLDGKKFPGEVKYDDSAHASTTVLASPWKFQKHGQCGADVSELLPGFARIVDDVVMLRGMQTGVNNHGQSIFALQNGRALGGRPTIGSWLTYAHGSESQELPAYVALADARGLPVLGVENWSNGWLPSLYQGTAIRPKEPRIPNLDPAPHLRGEAQANYLGFLQKLNQEHREQDKGKREKLERAEKRCGQVPGGQSVYARQQARGTFQDAGKNVDAKGRGVLQPYLDVAQGDGGLGREMQGGGRTHGAVKCNWNAFKSQLHLVEAGNGGFRRYRDAETAGNDVAARGELRHDLIA